MKLKQKRRVQDVLLEKYPRDELSSKLRSIRFPDNLSDLDQKSIIDLMAAYAKLCGLVTQDIIETSHNVQAAYEAENGTSLHIFQTNPGMNNQEKWKRDAFLSSDPTLTFARVKTSRLRTIKIGLELKLSTYERYVNTLSRSLTHRMKSDVT